MSSNKKQVISDKSNNESEKILMVFKDITSNIEITLSVREDVYEITTVSKNSTTEMGSYNSYEEAVTKYGLFLMNYSTATLIHPLGIEGVVS